MANTRAYARWLREQRESVRPRLTQSALAEEAGLSHNYISRLEKMSRADTVDPIHQPGAESLDKVSRALERFTRRPLVNEARQVIGYPLLADAPEPEPILPHERADRDL